MTTAGVAPKVHFYLDESGNPFLSLRTIQAGHRFFVLLAICVSPEVARDIELAVTEIAGLYSPSLPVGEVYIKSTRIRQKEYPFDQLEPQRLKSFTDDIYDILFAFQQETTLFAFIMDKQAHLDLYGIAARDPYLVAYTQLLERFAIFLGRRTQLIPASVYLDARDWKHHGKQDVRLQRLHTILQQVGSFYIDSRQFGRFTPEPHFIDSRASRLIQLADLCAYNLYHAWCYQKPDYPYFKIILPLFDKRPGTKQILGCGIKLFPESLQQSTEHFLKN